MEDPNGWNIAGQIAVGFTPAGVIADIRDLRAALGATDKPLLWYGVGVGIAVIGFIPGGDVLKQIDVAGKKVKEVAEGVISKADEIGTYVKKEVNQLGEDIAETINPNYNYNYAGVGGDVSMGSVNGDMSDNVFGMVGKGGGRKFNILKQNSKIWKKFKPYRGSVKTNGLSGKRKKYYEWDYTHNDIEVYNGEGIHLGSKDPVTGEIYKGPVNGRDIKDKIK